jgi:hypothetical protein
MKKIFFAVLAITILASACTVRNRQHGNHEKLEIFHQQKQVR